MIIKLIYDCRNMRRPPKALERERRVEALIAEARLANDRRPDENRLRDVIEDPSFSTGTVAPRTIAQPQIVRKPVQPNPEPEDGFGRIRRLHQDRKVAAFRRVLRELFTMIVSANAMGPIQPDEIELPDPICFKILCFNPDGTGRVEGGDYRDRFEELYGLLDGLDLRRIRECSSCKRLFWARRADQVGCQRICANRIRASRFYYRSNAQNAVK
jgi:hypothetical protein